MKALVTGANGFLGAWLSKRLVAEGFEVQTLVRKNSDLSELEGLAVEKVYGDVTDQGSLNAAIEGQDYVFHLAGVVSYRKSDRALMEKVNVQGTQNVVDACQKFGVQKLLHVSSVVAVGANHIPAVMNEDFKYNLTHLNLGYFETKRKAELIVTEAARAKKIFAVSVNPSTIYGFGDAKKGSRKTQIKVARQEFPFYTSGGINVVAVEDVVDGIVMALKNGKNSERYILSNQNLTIKDLFEKISYFAGVQPPKIYMPNWLLHSIGFAGDQLENLNINIGVSQENAYTATMFHWFDSAKAKEQLDFKTTSADKAIENSIRWMKDNGYLK